MVTFMHFFIILGHIGLLVSVHSNTIEVNRYIDHIPFEFARDDIILKTFGMKWECATIFIHFVEHFAV